jgi:hypothetical protein
MMMKILAAVGLGAALMLAPVLAYADDAAAPKADATMAPKPMVHHKHHTTKKPHHTTKKHHTAKKPMAAPAPADAPK